jgi:hypothetical protein
MEKWEEMKAHILDLTQEASDEVQAFVADLSDEERSAPGTLENWSAKDVVAHVTEWIVRLAAELNGAPSDLEPNEANIDQINAEIYRINQHRSWQDALERLAAGESEIRRQIQAMSEDDLFNRERLPWQRNRPVWRIIVGTLYTHTLLHLSYGFIERGDRAKALSLHEGMVERLLPLDDSPAWRGTNLYNLACNYALVGEKEKALANLGEALRLAPDLIAWSRQDADLVSLHNDPAYLAFVSGGEE